MASMNPSRMLVSLFLFSLIPVFENGYAEPSQWQDASQGNDPDPCLSCKRCHDCDRSCLKCPNCNKYFTITRSCAIAMAIGAGVGIYFAPVFLAVFGFTAAGVSATSLAALYQSTLGGVIAKGSFFAILQSVGAAGLSYSGAAGAAMSNFCEQLGSMTGMDMKCYSEINCK